MTLTLERHNSLGNGIVTHEQLIALSCSLLRNNASDFNVADVVRNASDIYVADLVRNASDFYVADAVRCALFPVKALNCFQASSVFIVTLNLTRHCLFSFITDKVFNNNATICQPDTRQQHVFASNGHIVDIQMITSNDVSHPFLMEYTGMRVLRTQIFVSF